MLPVVCIEWNDAVLRRSLNDTNEIAHLPLILHSVGFLLRSDKTGVSFCTDHDPVEGEFREQSFVPRGMITSEIILR